jgi:SAM-dependent methyltransferase
MAYVSPANNSKAADSEDRIRRVAKRLEAAPFLAEPLRRLGYDSSELWAWENYVASVIGYAAACRKSGRHWDGVVRVLEIGGGRGPLLSREEAAAAGIALTVNDIDARELSLAPPHLEKACFDIAGEVDPIWAGRFDLVISRMVMEHVRDAPRAWANMRALLAPGGVALAFHPTLYATPFLMNWLAPEALTAPVLRRFFPTRHDGDYPKFPARYEMCVANADRIGPILSRCGFSQSLIAPFWGHRYFRNIPGLREADSALHALAEARDWRWVASYSYTLARR